MRVLLHIVAALCLLAACSSDRQHRLLLAELERQNRADSLMTNDSLAMAVARWADDHGTPVEQLRAYYILGRTHADRGEMPQAMEAYNEAIDRADTTDAECFYTLCRVYAQKAEVFYAQLMPDNMIREERLAMHYALLAEDTMLYIYAHGMMAEGYETKSQLDSALLLLEQTYKMYNEIGAKRHASGLCCSIADIYRQKGDFARAELYMKEYEDGSGVFRVSGDLEEGKEMYYSCKGLLCLSQHDYVNAEKHFRKLLSVASTYELESAALEDLKKYYRINYNKDSLLKYDRLCDSLGNIIHIEVEIEKTLQVQAMYDYSYNERIAHLKTQEADRLFFRLLLSIASFFILLLLFLIFYLRHQSTRRQLENKIQVLSGYAVNERIHNSAIVNKFRTYLKDSLLRIPSFEDWKSLDSLVNAEVPTFYEVLNTDHQLSEFEYNVCLLVKAQISPSDIAKLKQCSPAYITQTRKKVYKKIFGRAGKAEELNEFILSLI